MSKRLLTFFLSAVNFELPVWKMDETSAGARDTQSKQRHAADTFAMKSWAASWMCRKWSVPRKLSA